jgi:hypothetical protein
MGIRSIVRSGRRRMCRSLDLAGDLDSVLDSAAGAALDGCLWGHVTASIRGTDGGVADGSARWASANTTAADSLHCTAAIASRT